jgi:hypothetical protein
VDFGLTGSGSFGTVECLGGGAGSPESSGLSALRISTACRKLTPSAAITQSTTEPPLPQAPRQFQRFFFGEMTNDGSLSS